MKKIFVIVLAALAFAACNMDFYSSDAMTGEQLKNDPDAPLFTTNGIYNLFYDKIAYKGQSGGESGNYYIRHYFQMAELRGDNVTVSGITEDPFINPYRYADDNTAKNIYYSWWLAYKIINAANANIGYIPESSDMFKHLIGENYFFRALLHFQMVTLFAMPYVQGRDNPGVPLMIGTENMTVERASVGDVYDAIVKDLEQAISYMAFGDAERCIDKGYVSQDAARALLARVYLYMGENDKCVEQCDALISGGHANPNAYDFADYPTHTYDSPETIWCSHLPDTHEWAIDNGEASIASMYIKALTSLKPDKTIGWGEHYWNENLIDLFRRNPSDERFKAYFLMVDPRKAENVEAGGEVYKPYKNYDEMYAAMDGYLTVVFPVTGQSGDYCTGSASIGCKRKADGSVKFKTAYVVTAADGTTSIDYHNHTAKLKVVHGCDSVYYVENDADFEGALTPDPENPANMIQRVWVRPGPKEPKPARTWDSDKGEYVGEETQESANAKYRGAMGRVDNGGFYMRYYNTKFSGQNGKPMMTSPVFLRWGEVYLNRAEALAKLGRDNDALNDVNVIRTRAGIPALTSADVKTLGYGKLLDCILDERRMELCFEGHRFFDVFRNNLPLDRRYVGYHTWEVIQPNDPRIAMLISQDEINASGIPQNPR